MLSPSFSGRHPLMVLRICRILIIFLIFNLPPSRYTHVILTSVGISSFILSKTVEYGSPSCLSSMCSEILSFLIGHHAAAS